MSRGLRVARRLRAGGRDEGFTLVEVMVALVLFAVLSTGVLSGLQLSLAITRGDQNRVVAADLAARQLEIARLQDISLIPAGTTTQPPVTVGSSTYTVRQTVVDVGPAGSGSSCDGGGLLSITGRSISEEVSWGSMGGVRPVRSDTLRSFTVAELDHGFGSLSVKVLNGANTPAAGHVVTLMPGGLSQTTDANGCVLFTGLDPKPSYSASLSTPGYIDPAGVASPVHAPITVLANRLTKDAAFLYDRRGSLTLTPVVTAGYPFPSTAGVTIANSFLAGGSTAYGVCGTAPCATGQWQLANVFPFVDGYRPWAGTCPSDAPTTSPPAVVVPPGGSAAASVPTAAILLNTMKKNTITPLANSPMVQVQNANCSSTVYQLGSSGLDAKIYLSLPAGTWTFSESTQSGTAPYNFFVPATYVFGAGGAPANVKLNQQ